MFFTIKVTVKKFNIQLDFSINFYGYKKIKNINNRIVYILPYGRIVVNNL